MQENAQKNIYDAPEVNTDAIKCKGCGGNMVFDPSTQKLKCPYCNYTEDFGSDGTVEEIAIEDALKKNESWQSETSSFRCTNCGAKIHTDKSITATICPFCGTAHVVKEADLEGIKPNAVIPFKLTVADVIKNFKSWTKKKLFAPRKFKKTASTDKIKGVYMPLFTFDSQTESVYEGRIGEYKTRTVRTKNGTRTETYTEWRHVSGTLSHFFDDIYINAGKRIDSKNVYNLLPFDYASVKAYDNAYLSGFYAHHYEKDISTCWKEAREEIDKKIKDLIVSKYHCDCVDYLNVSTHHSNVTFKYILAPVYIINYSYKKKNYTIYCNGSTGKFTGKTPVSPLRVAIAVVLGIAVVVGLTFLFMYLNE